MLEIFYLPLIVGLLVSITHVPLGFRVIDKGIVFLDIAIAQIAVLGFVILSIFHFNENKGNEPHENIISTFLKKI